MLCSYTLRKECYALELLHAFLKYIFSFYSSWRLITVRNGSVSQKFSFQVATICIISSAPCLHKISPFEIWFGTFLGWSGLASETDPVIFADFNKSDKYLNFLTKRMYFFFYWVNNVYRGMTTNRLLLLNKQIFSN